MARKNRTEIMLPVHYVRLIADQVQSRGVNVPRWLETSGLTEEGLGDPNLSLDLATFQHLVLNALTLTREPALGLFIGERLVPSTHGILGYAAINSSSIRQSLELAERFVGIRISLLKLSHLITRGVVRVQFTETYPLGEIQRPVMEAVMLSVKNMFDTISMGACQITGASFTFEETSYAPITSDIFGCDVLYRQKWNGFYFPEQFLDLPLKLADPSAFQLAATICQRELDKLASNDTFAARVRRLLLEKQNGFPSLQVVARQFHMTPRTLHRRLEDERTSFREILDEVRHTLAVEHLKSNRFNIEEIAFMLGYSDLSNFRRAFKRWESEPPSSFRTRIDSRGRHVNRSR
jgi:AraC-like DNA-binding protein